MPFFRGSSTQGLNQGLLHCWQILYHLSHQESPQSIQAKEMSDVERLLENSVKYLLKIKITGSAPRFPFSESGVKLGDFPLSLSLCTPPLLHLSLTLPVFLFSLSDVR